MKTITHNNHSFQVVDHIPVGHRIWNIGRHAPHGYLPVAVVSNDGFVNIATLKAIPMTHEEAQTILAATILGPNTVKEMEKFLKQSRSDYAKAKVAAALPLLKKVS